MVLLMIYLKKLKNLLTALTSKKTTVRAIRTTLIAPTVVLKKGINNEMNQAYLNVKED